VNLADVDRALADWKTRLQRIDENLVALETDPVYTLLEQAQGGGLDGATRAKVTPALTAMRELFAQRGLLDDVLERAAKLRAGIGRIFGGDGLKEIDHLLRGPSIALPPVETPLARRGLLDAAETTTAISPDQLLAVMMSAFVEARNVVAEVDAAWRRLTPEVDKAKSEANRLETLAGRLRTATAAAPLAAVRAQLSAVEGGIARDPLGAANALTSDINARLGQIAQQLDGLAARRDQVDADRRRAHTLLTELRSAHGRATEAHARCDREIEPTPRPAPAEPGQIEGLAQWLGTLDATVEGGDWAAGGVGLTRWLASAQEALSEEESAERASTAPPDKRDELAGRLAARRQQARTLAARGRLFDTDLEVLADRAGELLRRTPCPLAEAERLVAEYEARLKA
jgi:hypothetical protein